MRTLEGLRIGVTASRRAEEQVRMLERRGAVVHRAPVLAAAQPADSVELREATERVVAAPVDLLVATTGVGVRAWLDAAERWGIGGRLLATLGAAETIARGPKTVGALRSRGLRELWSPESECLDDVLAHLRGRDLAGRRVVVQEHGQSLSMLAHALRRQGAEVEVLTVYRVGPTTEPAAVFGLVDVIAERRLDAVTFTAAPAARALVEAAEATGRRDELLDAFRDGVLAASVGPVTAAELRRWDVPTSRPERSRLGALVALLERELPLRRSGLALDLAGGQVLRLHGERVLVDGDEVPLTPAPLAVLRALAVRPGHVVPRSDLLAALPSGTAASEHAVEMAVARLRRAVGATVVQTVVKRGYRLAVR